ncbi:oxidoreductase, short-chain dehydrogenase/reductase family [Thioalkalivibrio nitratireducens DSM 14787]|uniref:Oxidoreductase, short-chain dehydrogenase/reductase family n=1 Tax=Thioalkalivibrio nitratireducens (strain DSM 14787 / UNIQEM 213 / ALEN2) TaxID=1255043 RepID=L0E1R4_THIND|nr:SDR family oxidoreductase [Thioalkalivibrio nitratireducens]AGA34571.1 oxidoreductase, short-chain dehydrogenase/reductase family [Thioalkalivibrio nitratireducens DSM 14787]
MNEGPRRIAIFGANSRIAIEAARIWLAKGVHLVVVTRNPERLRRLTDDLTLRAAGLAEVHGIAADLADLDGLPALWESLRERHPDLEAVLIAHGTLPDQARCQRSPEAMLQALRLNALSAMTLLTVIANDFEARQRGVIGVIGSVAGDRGRKGNYVYGAGKGMLALFLQGLRSRLHASGVRVLTIKPGFVVTPMTEGRDRDGLFWARPERVARGIVRAFYGRRDVVYLPWFWRPILWGIRMIPEPLFKRLRL